MGAILSESSRPARAAVRLAAAAVPSVHFDFDVIRQPLPEEFEAQGLSGDLLRVRRLSTGVERVYTAGPGSTWFAEVTADLERGLFGRVGGDAPARARPMAS